MNQDLKNATEWTKEELDRIEEMHEAHLEWLHDLYYIEDEQVDGSEEEAEE